MGIRVAGDGKVEGGGTLLAIGGDGNGKRGGDDVIGSAHRRVAVRPHPNGYLGGDRAPLLPLRKSGGHLHRRRPRLLLHRRLIQAQVDGDRSGNVAFVIRNRHRRPGDGTAPQPGVGDASGNRRRPIGRLQSEIVNRC